MFSRMSGGSHLWAKRSSWALFLVALGITLLVGKATSQELVRDYRYFLHLLVDLERLPYLEEGITCKQFSSYD